MSAPIALENFANKESKVQFAVKNDQEKHKYDAVKQELSNNFSVEKSKFETDECECVCIKCNLWFKSLSALEDHDHTAHKRMQLLKCTYASEIFTNVNMVETHEKEHIITMSKSSSLNNKESTIKFIKNETTRAVDTQTAVNNAFDDKTLPGSGSDMSSMIAKSGHFDVNIVNKTFCNLTHQTQSHPNPSNNFDSNAPTTEGSMSAQVKAKPFSCHVCQKTFSHKTNLQIHLYNHREDKDKPFQCHVCHKGFSLKINLQSHLRVHSGERPFSCEICKKAFTVKSNLHNHLRTHTKEKPFKCEVCDKAFAQKCHLKTHYRSHSGEKPFVCHICGKAFSVQSNLQGHHRMHNGDRPFKCTICPKAFTMKSNLQSHLRMHSGDKPFECSLCEKAFSQKSNLAIHMRSHTGEKPFMCTICYKSFANKGTMTKHVTKVHGPVKQAEQEPEFYCTVCHLIFEGMDDLKKHELDHLRSIMSDLKKT